MSQWLGKGFEVLSYSHPLPSISCHQRILTTSLPLFFASLAPGCVCVCVCVCVSVKEREREITLYRRLEKYRTKLHTVLLYIPIIFSVDKLRFF